MSDRVAISNLALSKLGEDDQLTDPQDDSKPARSIRAVWDIVRDATLRAHPWNFATRRGLLSAIVTAPAFGYRYQFPLPPDFLRLLAVVDPWLDDTAYQNEGGAILADELGPLSIRYTARVEETGKWDALFVEAFAARLAWQIADRITGDGGRKADAWNAYLAAMREAKGVDGRENPPEPPRDSSWVLARYNSGYPGDWGIR